MSEILEKIERKLRDGWKLTAVSRHCGNITIAVLVVLEKDGEEYLAAVAAPDWVTLRNLGNLICSPLRKERLF